MRVTDQIWPEGTRPLVSVCCLTYNHEKFIQNAIEGFLRQKTRFPVEILIHDDASIDATPSVIREYQGQNPCLIRAVLQAKNQRSQGRKPFKILTSRAQGEFIALCEGDDYWTESEKLQVQWDFLVHNPRFSCCFHRTSLINHAGTTIQEEYFVPEGTEFDFRDCLVSLKKQYATCSMFFRKAALAKPRIWYSKSPNDMFLELQLSLHGKIGFIDRNMGAYRKHNAGVWTGLSGVQQHLKMLYRYQLLLEDPEIYKAYNSIIRHLIRKLEKGLCLKSDCVYVVWKQSFISRLLASFESICRKLRVQDLAAKMFCFTGSCSRERL